MSKKKLNEALLMGMMLSEGMLYDKDETYVIIDRPEISYMPEIICDPGTNHSNKPRRERATKRRENKARAVQARINKKWKK